MFSQKSFWTKFENMIKNKYKYLFTTDLKNPIEKILQIEKSNKKLNTIKMMFKLKKKLIENQVLKFI